jgi:hypothetical protein
MRRLLPVIIVFLAVWVWDRMSRTQVDTSAGASSLQPLLDAAADSKKSSFKCDGRAYCSEMTSCAEATYFLKNCPGVKMDGNHDGVPCEQQWCGTK